jgi:hypothetical protein
MTLEPRPGSSDQLAQAVYLLAGRLFRSADAPFGVVGSVDLGVAYVRKRHADADALLLGHRGLGVPTEQIWPTVEEIAVSVLNIAYSVLPPGKQDQLELAREAAIEYITTEVDAGIGVA